MEVQTDIETSPDAPLPLDAPTEAEEGHDQALPINAAALLDGTRSSAELAEAIEQAQADAREEEQRLAKLDGRREAALLEDDLGEVERLEEEARIARRNVERLGLLIGRLEDACHQAVEREAQARHEAVGAKSLKAQAEGVKKIREYCKLADKMVSLLKEMIVIEAFIEDCNGQLKGSGLDKVLPANSIERHKARELLRPEREFEDWTKPDTVNGKPKDPTWKPRKRISTIPAQYSGPFINQPLFEKVVLPAADWCPTKLWDPQALSAFGQDRHAQADLRAKLGLEAESED